VDEVGSVEVVEVLALVVGEQREQQLWSCSCESKKWTRATGQKKRKKKVSPLSCPASSAR
jgi:hypothetical protein